MNKSDHGGGKLKVLTVLGTRPEIIRLSQVMRRLDECVDHKIVHTGQSYDYELSEVFFRELGLRQPDHFLNIDASSLGAIYGNILISVEPVFDEERPDAVLILGDTNSAIAAILAKRKRIPVYHMEAGNRAFDFNVPEELNRRIVDHISDFNLVYTERSRQHLLAEGLPARRIYLTGSPMREVLEAHREAIDASTALEGLELEADGYYLVSVHREENVDDPDRLGKVLACLEILAEEHGLPIIVSTHPRTRKRLADLGSAAALGPGIRFMKPFGFLDYVKLQTQARCVISDSGTIGEESAILRFPAVTLRDSMERPETLDAGTLMMAPLEPTGALRECVELQVASRDRLRQQPIPWEYEIGNTSDRVVKLILGTARLSNLWHGVRRPGRSI